MLNLVLFLLIDNNIGERESHLTGDGENEQKNEKEDR